MTGFRVPAGPGESELTEKRSRFLGHLRRVDSGEEAKAFILQIKKQYHDARHNCWCWRIGDDLERFSDDGEPQGSAGKPMLEVFRREDVTNLVCVVTRYFGGVLLGTGGLSRAYAGAAKEALLDAGFRLVAEWTPVRFSCPYPLLERCKGSVAALGGEIGQLEYGEDVRILALLPAGEAEKLVSSLTEFSGGSIHAEIEESIRK
ncbi:MAG: YigZ family protein [Oscillospiraceae bacterium]|nr:YigZ family protein [Oscillospiraceae bacterium]